MNKTKLLLELTKHLAKSKKPVMCIVGDVAGMPITEIEALEQQGYHVINPADFIDLDGHWLEVRKQQIIMLANSDSVWFRPGWEDSREAKYLHQVALLLHITPILN
jgi:hypothetical protein